MKLIRLSVRRMIGLVLAIVLAGCQVLPGRGAEQGALQVTSSAGFNVYLNEVFLGQTPFFDDRIAAGDYLVKLVATGSETVVWQKQVRIGTNALAVVHFDKGETAETSSSQLLELEKLPTASAVELAVTTLPDTAVLKLDGETQGFAPKVFTNIGAGDHVVEVEAAGYVPKVVNVKTNQGYRLRLSVELGRDPKLMLDEQGLEAEVATASGQTLEEQGEPEAQVFGEAVNGVYQGAETEAVITRTVKAQVKQTGTGWLRCRAEPNGLSSNEVARVAVGKWFGVREISENEEWVEIEYDQDKFGWVSVQYVTVVDQSEEG